MTRNHFPHLVGLDFGYRAVGHLDAVVALAVLVALQLVAVGAEHAVFAGIGFGNLHVPYLDGVAGGARGVGDGPAEGVATLVEAANHGLGAVHVVERAGAVDQRPFAHAVERTVGLQFVLVVAEVVDVVARLGRSHRTIGDVHLVGHHAALVLDTPDEGVGALTQACDDGLRVVRLGYRVATAELELPCAFAIAVDHAHGRHGRGGVDKVVLVRTGNVGRVLVNQLRTVVVDSHFVARRAAVFGHCPDEDVGAVDQTAHLGGVVVRIGDDAVAVAGLDGPLAVGARRDGAYGCLRRTDRCVVAGVDVDGVVEHQLVGIARAAALVRGNQPAHHVATAVEVRSRRVRIVDIFYVGIAFEYLPRTGLVVGVERVAGEGRGAVADGECGLRGGHRHLVRYHNHFVRRLASLLVDRPPQDVASAADAGYLRLGIRRVFVGDASLDGRPVAEAVGVGQCRRVEHGIVVAGRRDVVAGVDAELSVVDVHQYRARAVARGHGVAIDVVALRQAGELDGLRGCAGRYLAAAAHALPHRLLVGEDCGADRDAFERDVGVADDVAVGSLGQIFLFGHGHAAGAVDDGDGGRVGLAVDYRYRCRRLAAVLVNRPLEHRLALRHVGDVDVGSRCVVDLGATLFDGPDSAAAGRQVEALELCVAVANEGLDGACGDVELIVADGHFVAHGATVACGHRQAEAVVALR